MSTTIEAGLRMQIAGLQAGFAEAKKETAKFKQDLVSKGADLDKKFFESLEKHKLNLGKARTEVEELRALFKAKGEALEKALFEKIEKHKLDLSKLKDELKSLKEMGRGGSGGSILGDILGAQVITGTLSKGVQIMSDFISRGVAFNMTMDTSQVGIANLLKKFDGLNDAAAKDEAAKAMKRIIELEPSTAGTLQDLLIGFKTTLASAKSVGFTTGQNIELTAKFANALANAGIQADQLAQEYSAILSGNINADAKLAKILGITNEDVAAIKASGGDLFAFLNEKLGEMGTAGDSAAVAWSSFQSGLDKAAGDFASGLFEQGIATAKDLAVWLAENKDLFVDLGKSAADGMGLAVSALKSTLELVKEIKGWIDAPAKTKARMDGLIASAKQPPRNPEDVYVETTSTGGAGAAAQKDKADLDREKLMALNARRSGEGLPALDELPDAAPKESTKEAAKKTKSTASKAAAAAKKAAAEKVAAAAKKAREEKTAADKLERTREQLAEATQSEKYGDSSLAEKIKLKQGEVKAAGNQAAFAGEAGSEQDKLEALIAQAEAQKELNALIKEQAENVAKVKDKMESERESFIDKLEKQKQSKQSLLEELSIAGAKLRGDDKAAEAMEREKKIREEARRIHEAVGGSTAAARRSAEILFAGDEKDAKRKNKDEEIRRDDGAKHIGGVTKRTLMGSGLDEFYRNQRRDGTAETAFGRRGLGGGDEGMLSGRHAANAASADAAGARNDRDPAPDILKEMLTFWKEQIGK